ncbi:aminoacyl-tRNA hydrolase [Candidatus Poribacteria bacterium]|nr:MAG: aminoacyl-tRNA hydrolase [Candidatus Poribacteria bacterium]
MECQNRPDKTVKLIVGLGNPGMRYEQTKHNIGFRVIDAIYDKTLSAQNTGSVSTKRVTSICKSLIIPVTLHDSPIILAKPMTYMNNSGFAVTALVNRFEVPLTDLCIIYDDIHLDIGTIRIRQKGSDGGQKGMQSIIYHLGTTEFPRLRIGIGEPVGGLTDYVLSEFSGEEKTEIGHTVERAVEAVETFVQNGVLTAMNRFNGR